MSVAALWLGGMSIQRNPQSRVWRLVIPWVALGGRNGKVDLEQLKVELRRDEGLRLHVYRCTAGHRTIGYGHLVDKTLSIRECTKADAEIWLDSDIQGAIKIADVFLWPMNLHSFSELRQRAIVNMAFNLGFRLCKFKRLRKALLDEDWRSAGAEVRDSLYARQVGARAERIARMLETNDA